MAVAALILGILAILGCLIPVLNIFSFLLAVTGLVLGALALRRVKRNPTAYAGKGQAMAGLILSGLAILGVILSNALFGAVLSGVDDQVTSSPPAVVDEAEIETPLTEPSTDSPSPAPEATEQEQPEPVEEEASAAVGEPITVGNFQYTVNGVEFGVSNVGGEFGKTAQGQFCLLDLSVTNVGDSSSTFFSDSVTMLNDAGQQYSADDVASIFVEGNDTFFAEINPGNTLEGTVVFDIPVDQTPSSVELTGGLFSGDGETVRL